uniref:TPR repeat n=1 Tax=Chlorobium chlorochromatii (strain CaD3) TaxID=340177 RepID=Q3APQ6_CHLCH
MLMLAGCSSSSSTVSTQKIQAPLPKPLPETVAYELATASLLMAQGEYQQALERYRALLTTESNNAALHHALAKAYTANGEFVAARQHSQQSVTLEGTNVWYLRLLIALTHNESDYAQAVALSKKLVTLEPDNREALTMLAYEHLAARQPNEALEVFQRLLQLDPANAEVLLSSAEVALELGRRSDALRFFNQLLHYGIESDSIHFFIGDLQQQQGLHEAALASYRNALKLNPHLLPAWYRRLELVALSPNLSQSSKPTLFAEELQHFYKQSGTTLEQQLGLLQLFTNRATRNPAFISATQSMIKALQQRYSSHSLVRFTVQIAQGRLFVAQGQHAQAITLLRQALRSPHATRQPNVALDAESTLALAYERSGKVTESIRLYEKMLRRTPNNALLANNLAYLLATQHRELPRALELAKKAVAAEPNNPIYLDTLGWVHFAMQQYEPARELLEKALQGEPNEPEVIEHLIAVYEKLGNQSKVQELQERLRRVCL